MLRLRRHRILRAGIVAHGSNLWISELLSIAVVAVLLGTLGGTGAVILRNRAVIRNRRREIAVLRAEKISAGYLLRELREKDRIARILYSFTRGRVDQQVVATVAGHVYRSANRYGYDPLLLLAVIHVESVFEPRALGRFRSGKLSGALGLMQLKYETAREVARDLGMELRSEDDLFRPEINLVLGAAYLTRVIALFKSFKLGLLAYNQGPGTILESLTKNKPLSIRYYEKVLRSYYRLEKIAEEEAEVNRGPGPSSRRRKTPRTDSEIDAE